jgi:hypothetical protein
LISTSASKMATEHARLAKLFSKAYGSPADLGVDGKVYRANSVHALFPDNLSTWSGREVCSFQPADYRFAPNPKR